MTTTLRWGVVGAGAIARRRMIPGLLSAGHELRAVCRRDRAAAEEVAAEFGAAAATDPEEVFGDRSIDAVYIATPPDSHERLAVAALRAGKHVLLEKPMSLDAAAALRITEEAARSGRALMLGYMMREHPLHRRMRDSVSSGAIGALRLVRADFCFEYSAPDDWRAFSATSGGGAFADLGPHLIDLISWISGVPPRAVGALATGEGRRSGSEPAATALLQLDGDAHAMITTRFDHAAERSPRSLEFWGTEGALVAHQTVGQESCGWLTTPDGRFDVDGPVDLYAAQAATFRRLVNTPSEWRAHREQALLTQQVTDDVYAAMAVSSP